MLLELQYITKLFPGVTALKDVSLTIKEGEVHALCGENGAGKSTLMQILSGNLQPTSGNILINGKLTTLAGPSQALSVGISIVHQEKSLVGSLSVAENIFVGRQPVNSLGLIDRVKLNTQTASLLMSLDLSYLSPKRLVRFLTHPEQKMIQIAKALSTTPALLILDEPTAALTEKETTILFKIIRRLKAENTAIVYISHRLREIFTIADQVSVLKNGRSMGTKKTSEIMADTLIKMMVGRNIEPLQTNRIMNGETVLQMDRISGKGFADISFSIRKGEIVGLAGLVGAGRTEIAKAIFGANTILSGSLLKYGKQIQIQDTCSAIKNGIGYISEDRKTEGAFLTMGVAENIISANFESSSKKGLFSNTLMFSLAEFFKRTLNIITPSLKQKLCLLSGGNQQKVIIAKWMLTNPDILIADEPTQGIDIGAKFEIYKLLQGEAAKGKAILIISSEMPELLMLCDTIHVIKTGRLVSSFSHEDATEEKIMAATAN